MSDMNKYLNYIIKIKLDIQMINKCIMDYLKHNGLIKNIMV